MAITRTYTYLGKTTEGYHIYEGVYTIGAAGDLYDRDARPTLTFAGLASVVGIIGLTSFPNAAGNLGNPVVPVSIATNVVTIMVLETGAGAGVGLAEKTDDEAYGVAGVIRCTVYGL